MQQIIRSIKLSSPTKDLILLILANGNGILLFIEVREVIPKKQKGSSTFFLLGVVLYSMLIGASWMI